MKIENIHNSWGSIVHLDNPQEFFHQPEDFWRDLVYERRLIFFKTVDFTHAEYAEFSLKFGSPWTEEDYKYSKETSEIVESPNYGKMVISWISETSKRLGVSDMPWHADIPNRDHKPFPMRALWIVDNPRPQISGRTKWLNLELAIDYLTPDMKELLPRIRIIQQSWYNPGSDIQEHDFLKTHPITGKQSLRLNYFNWKQRTEGWITGVKIDGVLQPDCRLVKEWLEYLERIPELVYEHIWDTKDISIYDNWPFVHARSRLFLDTNNESRKFYRINIDHLDSQEWAHHKIKYLK